MTRLRRSAGLRFRPAALAARPPPPRSHARTCARRCRAGLLLAGLLLAAALLAPGTPRAADERVPGSQAEIQLSFAPAVRRALPSVVSIYARRLVRERGSLFGHHPFLREFFGDMFPESTRRRMENSLGSGVLVRPDGVVITAEHVIRGAEEIRVVLADRREFSAEIRLADPVTDLAVLQLNGAGDDLPALTVRDADEMQIGDLVLAIGNPLGVGQTVTSGIVSALARSNGAGTWFIQTDAAINVGNSGGALVDAAGRLVGVNTAIVTRSGGSDGIGLAVPSNLAMRALAAAMAGETEIPRPWVGVNGQELTPEILDAVGLDRPRGFLATLVDSRSGFASAGVEAGDVILSVDGHPVHNAADLVYRFLVRGPGARVTTRVLRQGREFDAAFALSLPPLEPPPDARQLGRGAGALAGVEIANASPALAVQLQVPSAGIEGVILRRVSGVAARWFLPGDLIRSLNGERVRDVDELSAAIGRADDEMRLVIERQGRRRTLEFTR